jgi:LysM repeat protein
MRAMKALSVVALAFALALCAHVDAQTFAGGNGDAKAQLELLTKKIEEQNLKIDTLSQQILKLEQRITSSQRPGVMIGESTPAPAPASAAAQPTAAPAGNSHIVAKGETLISIAKAHKVDVDLLQKHNNIEDARKLQAGQTLIIPTPGASPAASPEASPNE